MDLYWNSDAATAWDALELLNAGCHIIASDLSTENLRATKLTAPHADNVQLDHSQPLPFANHSIDVILASLTLHYFSWDVTLQIASELKRCLSGWHSAHPLQPHA